MDFAAMFIKLITKNGLVAAFIIIGITTWIAYKIGGLTKGRIHGSAIAIFFGLILAYIGGVVGGGHKGLASIPMFAGVGVMGGAMFRDFAIVSTAFGADLREIKKVGLVGVLSLIFGLLTSWVAGVGVAYAMGYTDSVSLVTIGAGVATFVVGPVTGASLGASSEVIAISIAAGVVKSVLVMILTPFVAKFVGLDNPQSAMILWRLDGYYFRYGCRYGRSRSQTGSVCGNDSYILYRFRLSGISVNSVFCNKSYFWLSNDPGRKQVQRCMITKLKN